MIVEELHYEFKLRWDKQANNQRKGMTDLEIDRLLNNAVNTYVYIFGTGKNPQRYDVGFEVDQQMIDMIQTLVTDTNLTPSPLNNNYVTDLPQDYRYYITSVATDKDCGEVPITLEQHGDLVSVKMNYHRKPNKRFLNIPAFIRGDRFHLHTDGLFTLNNLLFTYIKDPAEICIGTYTEIPTQENPDPAVKVKQECDLPSDYHNIVVDLAVQEASRIYLDANRYQLGRDKLNDIT